MFDVVAGIIITGVILLSRRYNVDPDNVATPIAASLGDVITLALLSGFVNVLYKKNVLGKWAGLGSILLTKIDWDYGYVIIYIVFCGV